MKSFTRIKPISYLKSHAADVVTQLTETRGPMLITQNGEAKLVVMDVQSYEAQEQALALLKILALGQAEIERKKYRSASEVLAELDRLE